MTKPITLPAHFDGEHIRLDEPFELKPETRLLVTVLPQHDEEATSWLRLSGSHLERAYGEEEAEYPTTTLRQAVSSRIH